jgi:hypothetical protein
MTVPVLYSGNIEQLHEDIRKFTIKYLQDFRIFNLHIENLNEELLKIKEEYSRALRELHDGKYIKQTYTFYSRFCNNVDVKNFLMDGNYVPPYIYTVDEYWNKFGIYV